MRFAPTAALLGIATLGVPIPARATSLDKDTVRRVFGRHVAQIKSCYEQRLEKDRKLHGRLVVKVTIDGNGRVSAAEISDSELADETLHACITDAVRMWDFPFVGNHAVYTIAHPYVFEPARLRPGH
jgi:outer membrane biosynthesis protein TonB